MDFSSMRFYNWLLWLCIYIMFKIYPRCSLFIVCVRDMCLCTHVEIRTALWTFLSFHLYLVLHWTQVLKLASLDSKKTEPSLQLSSLLLFLFLDCCIGYVCASFCLSLRHWTFGAVLSNAGNTCIYGFHVYIWVSWKPLLVCFLIHI